MNVSRLIPLFSGKLWTPTQISSALALWLDASDASTITLSSGNVSSWANKGLATASAATQGTAASQPAYSATGFDGTRPGVTFDGSDDFLTTTNPAWAQPFSVLMVLNAYTGGSGNANLYRSAIGTGPVGYRAGLGSVWSIFAGAALSGAGPYTASAAIRHDIFSGTSSAIRRDGGAAVLTGDAGTQGIASGFFEIGRGGALSTNAAVKMGEFFVINRALTTDELAKLEGYVAWKWGLQANLPAAHPYRNSAPRV